MSGRGRRLVRQAPRVLQERRVRLEQRERQGQPAPQALRMEAMDRRSYRML